MSAYRIHERFLRHMWIHLAASSLPLTTTDGRSVIVDRPGRFTTDAGPDISCARLRIGDSVFAGHVEIHRTVDEWTLHGHHLDPGYNSVILHVVLERPHDRRAAITVSGRTIPTLVIADNVQTSLRLAWEAAIRSERRSRLSTIACAGVNHDVPPKTLDDWLAHVETERLEIKLRRFEERLYELATRRPLVVRENQEDLEGLHDGPLDEIPPPQPELTRFELARRGLWDQLMYEGLLEGLGYSRNRKPFIRLSQTLTLDVIRQLASDSLQREALFLGVAGLLPSAADLADDDARSYVGILRREWATLSEQYRGERLLPTDWVLAPTRPHNAPVLRLVAAHMIASRIIQGDLFRLAIDGLRNSSAAAEVRSSLHRLLQIEPGPFWSHRMNFDRSTSSALRLLGSGRKDDLVVNTFLPLGLLYARIFRRPGLRRNVLRLLEEYPATEPNRITRRMERELIRGRVHVRTAGRQQALVQLYNYYCSDGRCNECAVGRWLWGDSFRDPVQHDLP